MCLKDVFPHSASRRRDPRVRVYAPLTLAPPSRENKIEQGWPGSPLSPTLGGTARWLQLQPSSAWPRRRKRSKMLSLCTTRITARSSWDSSGFFTFISRLSSCFAGVIWFAYDVIMTKEKCGLDDGCTILIFSADDGCTRWWPWLHYFGRVIFGTHTAVPLHPNMLIGCMIVVKCDTCKISGAYAYLDCIKSTVGDIGNRHSMQITHSDKERIFRLFPPQQS